MGIRCTVHDMGGLQGEHRLILRVCEKTSRIEDCMYALMHLECWTCPVYLPAVLLRGAAHARYPTNIQWTAAEMVNEDEKLHSKAANAIQGKIVQNEDVQKVHKV